MKRTFFLTLMRTASIPSLVSLVLLGTFSSCKEELILGEPVMKYSQTFIDGLYDDAKGVMLTRSSYSHAYQKGGKEKYNKQEVPTGNSFSILFYNGTACSSTNNAERFTELCQQFGDTAFWASKQNFFYNYYAEPIEKITIISGKNYDRNHLAGTPLDDIVQFSTYTPYRLIQDGYPGVTDTEGSREFLGSHDYVDWKRLCDLGPEDLTLIEDGGTLIRFTSPPQVQNQPITITVYFVNGKVLSNTQTINITTAN